MVAVRSVFSESYPAVRESVPRARSAVTAYAADVGGVRGRQLDDVRTAVSEAVTNAVLHAYRDREGEVRVTATVAEGDLWVLVADDGCGYRTPARHPGMGLGMALMAHASDEFVVTERAEGGTEVQVRFTVDGPEAGD